MFVKLYKYIFSRSIFSKVNNWILTFTLAARGYDNYRNKNESGEKFFINKVLSPTNPILCLDIGANIGLYTIELLRNTNSKVICFEPLPKAFQILSETTRDMQHRVTLEKKGVGKKIENLYLHFNPSENDTGQQASFSEDVKKVSYVSNEAKILAPIVTLDSYCEEKNITDIDLIKIDTEGFESEIFEGATNTFSKIRPKFIQIEFNWHHLFRNISLKTFAEKLPDYQVYQLIPNGWVKRDPRDPLTNIYYYSNFVFVRK